MLNPKEIYNTLPPYIFAILANFQGSMLAGGALRSMIDQTPVCDYDFYFNSPDVADKVRSFLTDAGAIKIFQCPENKLTTFKLNGMKIQLITIKYFKHPLDVIALFDINAARHIFTVEKDKTMGILHSGENSVSDAENKIITLHSITWPLATFKRIERYKNKGYSISEEEWKKYLKWIKNSPDSDDEILFYVD